MQMLDFLVYFLCTAFATACGVCYWMAVENTQRKGFKAYWVFVFSFLITPFGAWLVSLILREKLPVAPGHAMPS